MREFTNSDDTLLAELFVWRVIKGVKLPENDYHYILREAWFEGFP